LNDRNITKKRDSRFEDELKKRGGSKFMITGRGFRKGR